MMKLCEALYTSPSGDVSSPSDLGQWSDLDQNTIHLIREIRDQARKVSDLPIYALLVFDCAMIQLGGLAVQSRGNKIASPKDAVTVAEIAAQWLIMVAPNIST